MNRIHSLFTTQFFKAIKKSNYNLLRGQNGDFCQKPLGPKDPGPHTSYSTACYLCFEISHVVFYDYLYGNTVVKRRQLSGTCLNLFCQLKFNTLKLWRGIPHNVTSDTASHYERASLAYSAAALSLVFRPICSAATQPSHYIFHQLFKGYNNRIKKIWPSSILKCFKHNIIEL